MNKDVENGIHQKLKKQLNRMFFKRHKEDFTNKEKAKNKIKNGYKKIWFSIFAEKIKNIILIPSSIVFGLTSSIMLILIYLDSALFEKIFYYMFSKETSGLFIINALLSLVFYFVIDRKNKKLIDKLKNNDLETFENKIIKRKGLLALNDFVLSNEDYLEIIKESNMSKEDLLMFKKEIFKHYTKSDIEKMFINSYLSQEINERGGISYEYMYNMIEKLNDKEIIEKNVNIQKDFFKIKKEEFEIKKGK